MNDACKREGMHADVWGKTSYFFHLMGRASDIKRYGFPFYPTCNFSDDPLKYVPIYSIAHLETSTRHLYVHLVNCPLWVWM